MPHCGELGRPGCQPVACPCKERRLPNAAGESGQSAAAEGTSPNPPCVRSAAATQAESRLVVNEA